MKILTASVLFLAICFSGCRSQSPDEKFEGIKDKLMTSASDLTKVPAQIELTDQPYIKGKIAVFQALDAVQMGGTGVNKVYVLQNLYYRDMPEIYAAAPEEVGTVALLNCQTVKKGVYKTNSGSEYPAEVEDCDLTLIDRSKPAVIYKKKFEKEPSDERRVTGNFVGRQSSQEDVSQFLKTLPRK